RPWMARSKVLPVVLTLPWVWFFSVATTRTPVPRFSPVGAWVLCEVLAPTWDRFWYSRSSKTARLFLKPVVLTLARLFAVTVICVCWASSPVLAAQSAGSMCVYLSINKVCGGAGLAGLQQLGGGLTVVLGGVQGLDLHVKAAREL